MSKFFTILIPCLLLVRGIDAQTLEDFSVRESERAGETIELVVLDASGNQQSSFSGKHPFSINGFETELDFSDGSAYFLRAVASSNFLYMTYIGANDNVSYNNTTHLYYLYRGMSGDFTVIYIPLFLLIFLPSDIILLFMFF